MDQARQPRSEPESRQRAARPGTGVRGSSGRLAGGVETWIPAPGGEQSAMTRRTMALLQRSVGNRAAQRGIARLDTAIQRRADTHNATIHRHGGAELEEQLEQAKLQEEMTIQAKHDPVAALNQPRAIRPLLQRHQVDTSTLYDETTAIVPKAEDGKWPEWKIHDVVSHTEMRMIKDEVSAMIMQQKGMDLKTKTKLRQRLQKIEIKAERKRTVSATPAISGVGELTLDTRHAAFFTPDGELDKATIRSTLIHEMFHCLAINHEGMLPQDVTNAEKGFQGDKLALDDSTKTTETLDEAVTDWFSYQVYKTVYPRGTYKTGYFARAEKKDEKDASSNASAHGTSTAWAGEQIPILLKELGISEQELLRMYLHDHKEMTALIEAKKEPLKKTWLEKKKEAHHRVSPLSNPEELKALVIETCRELGSTLSAITDRTAQLTRVQEELKRKGVAVNLVNKNKFVKAQTQYVDAAASVLDTLAPTPATPEKASEGKINVQHVVTSLKALNLLEGGVHAPLNMLVVTPAQTTDTPLNEFPDSQRYGTLPSKSLKDLGAPAGVSAHGHIKDMGGAAYEDKTKTGFLNTEFENSYYHYLHEVGHFKQSLGNVSEYTVPNRMLLEYHNIVLYENTEKHTRTRYKEDISVGGGATFADVKKDAASHATMTKMLLEIEQKLETMSKGHRELIKRNLAIEYFKEKAANPPPGRVYLEAKKQ